MVGVAFICCTFVAKIKCHRRISNKQVLISSTHCLNNCLIKGTEKE